MNSRVGLIILDGRGLTSDQSNSAIAQANTPMFDHLRATYPHTSLEASGEAVGLPVGQMGNSEVGHMHIGAGAVIYQDFVKISKSVTEDTLKDNAELIKAIKYAKINGSRIHIMGLLSDGGVHAHDTHIHGLCRALAHHGVSDFAVHVRTDGRDTAPTSGIGYVADLLPVLAETGGVLASMIGRYYAMDRDWRLDTKTKLAYDLLVHGTGTPASDPIEALQSSYDQGVTDEFVQPIIFESDYIIRPNDVVICANYRTDRPRQITTVLTQQDYPEFEMHTLPLYYVTMTSYDATYQDVHVLFDTDTPTDTLGSTISAAGRTQLRIAESEKYPHVTFFFSGGQEAEFAGEHRIVINSPQEVFNYDEKPAMSSGQLTDEFILYLQASQPDFVCCNYCNPDIVGHTGNFQAVVQACEAVDQALSQIIPVGLDLGYTWIIIADHGNAEMMRNPDSSPHTNHTTNLVPCIIVSKDPDLTLQSQTGGLIDIAPTVLNLMGIAQPDSMTGESLIVK